MKDFVSTFRIDPLAGKCVILTGALSGSGIGLDIARCFAVLSADVIATGSST